MVPSQPEAYPWSQGLGKNTGMEKQKGMEKEMEMGQNLAWGVARRMPPEWQSETMHLVLRQLF